MLTVDTSVISGALRITARQMSTHEDGKNQFPLTDSAHRRADKTQARPRGRPSISSQRARDNSNARGSIEAFVTPSRSATSAERSRKRPADSPEEKPGSTNPTKKANEAASPTLTYQTDATLNTNSTDPFNMDKLLDEIRGMREENAKQFENMSKQLVDSATAHDKKLADLAREFQNYKLENERANRNLQTQIHTLRKETQENSGALAARVQAVETQITSGALTQSQSQHSSAETLLDKIEQLEKEAKRLNLIFKGLETSHGSAKAVASRFLDKEYNMQNKIVEARFIPGEGTKRPIVVKLDSWETKQTILAQKANFRHRNIYIDLDLTARQGKAAKALRDAGKQLKAEGRNIKHGNLGLQIDGIWHYWSERDNGLRAASRSSSSAASSSGASSRAESTTAGEDPATKN